MKLDQDRLCGVIVALLLIALCVVMRLVDHAPNFTPLAATAIFSGFFFRSRLAALGVPIAAMLASDLIGPGLYDWRMMLVVYACLALPALLGRFVRGRLMPLRIVGASLVASTLFFLATNLAHFLWMPGYEHTLAGLVECYALALPFFGRNTFAGDLAWSFALFGAWALAPIVLTRLHRTTQRRLA